MAQYQVTVGKTGETKIHIEQAKEIWPEIEAESLLIKQIISEWYEFQGANYDQMDDLLNEAATIWPEIAKHKGLLTKKIVVEFFRNRSDGRRAEIAERLERIENSIHKLLAAQTGR